MLPYVEYLDLPRLSDELLLSAKQILSLDASSTILSNSHRVEVPNPRFYPEVRQISPELKLNLKNIFKQRMASYYVVAHQNLILHRDLATFSIIYLLDSGGENIKTTFFDSSVYPGDVPYYNCKAMNPDPYKNMIVHEEILPVKTWIKLNTHIPHCVTGQLMRPRVHLNITLEDAILSDLPSDKFPILE